MRITPDAIVLAEWGPLHLNATVVFTWVVMALLVVAARLVTARLSDTAEISRWQNLLEVVVETVREQIGQVAQRDPDRFLPFIGTLFLFIAVCNALAIVPGFEPPTGSLSTTTALALCVLVAVPAFGVGRRGFVGYLRKYLEPTPLMLPFNVTGEVSRTVALAVRLYGNVMSGTVIVAILIALVPVVFPVVMEILGLLTGLIQAYIFAVLAMVYIASATADEPAEAAQRPSPSANSNS